MEFLYSGKIVVTDITNNVIPYRNCLDQGYQCHTLEKGQPPTVLKIT